MATAEAPLVKINLPNGTNGNNRSLISSTTRAVVQRTIVNDDGEAVTTDLGEMPLGTQEIYTQARFCGDFYCEIRGARHVSAIGDTLETAFLNALSKAA